MNKYKSALPKPSASYTELANFCVDHGCSKMLFLASDAESNKELDALTKKYPELWEVVCQKYGNDERLEYYQGYWNRASICQTLGNIVMWGFAIGFFGYFFLVFEPPRQASGESKFKGFEAEMRSDWNRK